MKAKQRAPALRGWATRRFGCEQRRLQSNFVAAEPPGTEDHAQRAGNPGNVGSDACTGREPELAIHIRFALRQGWTEEELTEVLLHLSGYIGVPIIRESMMVASRAFREYREEKE